MQIAIFSPVKFSLYFLLLKKTFVQVQALSRGPGPSLSHHHTLSFAPFLLNPFTSLSNTLTFFSSFSSILKCLCPSPIHCTAQQQWSSYSGSQGTELLKVMSHSHPRQMPLWILILDPIWFPSSPTTCLAILLLALDQTSSQLPTIISLISNL